MAQNNKIEIFNSDKDDVIESYVGLGKTTYEVALNDLYPLINRFDAQRKIQDKKFYRRLQNDLIEGCIMPPITIAFIDRNRTDLSQKEAFNNFVNNNLANGYILDGLQRLNTLKTASEHEGFDINRVAYINVIVAESQDKLLYRMITLNNGQKPMTPRHQIEILTAEMFDFNRLNNISIQTEKERSEKIIRGSFNLGDISRAYLSFLTGNVNNENNKIIDEKMDEILVSRVLDNRDASFRLKFENILDLVDALCINSKCKEWFKVNNNLIGFCVGIRDSYQYIRDINADNFAEMVTLFDVSFESINASKVNLGKYRRQLSAEFIKNYQDFIDYSEEDLIEHFVEFTS